MPNWKKVIVSGSNAVLNNITASGNVSGSATSTASFGHYIGIPSSDPFPYTASSGPAIISQSFTAGNVDSTALRLFGSGSVSQSGIFEVEGSAGPLFSVQDGLDGILMEVNNISGLPLFQVSSSNEVFINRGNLTSGVTTATASFAHFTGSFQGDGTNLTGITVATPTLQQVVTAGASAEGDVSITGSLTISGSFSSFTLDSDNIVLGSGAGTSMQAGADNNVILGTNAGTSLTTGDKNVIIGNAAGAAVATDSEIIYIGNFAGESRTGAGNIAIGNYAAQSSAASSDVIAIGRTAARYTTGGGSIAIGRDALKNGNTDVYNIAIGFDTGEGSTLGPNIAIGAFALKTGGNGRHNTIIGHNAGEDIQGGYGNTMLGHYAGKDLQSGTGNIIIGSGSLGTDSPSNQLRIGNGNSIVTISGSLTTGDVIFYNTASAPNFSGSFQGDGSGLTNLPSTDPFPFTGDAQITGSLIVSGSSSPLISLPNAPTNAVIISGSSNRTRLLIHDSGKSNSPLYTEGAGIVLSGGEGSGIQSTLEITAAGSSNGGNNNEQSFIRSNQQLVIRGNDNDAGDNIKFLGSHDNYGLKFDASTSGVTLTYNTNGGSTVSELNMGNGTYIQANASGTYYKIGRSSTDWLNLSSTKATFAADVSSSSATSTASFGTYIGDGSQLTNLPAASAGSTAGRVVFTTTNGELTSETGFTYDATTDRLTVPNLTTTTFTASFITSSTIETSGSNIFGDEAGVDVQTLVGTTKMTGSAEIDGNTQITGSLEITGSLKMIRPSNKLDLSIGSNIIIGREAGNSISDDRGAIFLGYKAGYTNTNPNANIAIGYGAGGSLGTNASQQNIFMGYLAGAGNTSIGSITSRMSAASNNIGMGYQALLYLTSGDQNIALGAAVMRNISTGGNNTALGAYALYNTDSGDNNIGIGYYAGLNQTSGDGNITIGSGSLGIAGESNQLRIGQGNGDALIHGDFDSGSITFNVSGSDAFQVIGTEGTLFAVDDDLDGTIFSANDRSGLPVLEASASGEVYIGKAPQSLYTTAVISSTTAATTQSIYGLSTSSYGGAFFDYTVQSGSDARAGSIMSVWNGSNISFTETTTTDIGDTTDFNVIVHISESQAQIASHATRAGYNIKTIIRSI